MPRSTGQAKLSEISRKNQLLFAQQTNSFEEAYPTISKLRVSVLESGGSFGKTYPSSFTKNSFKPSVDCNNGVCYGGGVEIGRVLHDVVQKRMPHHEFKKKCCGYEGNSRKKHRDCLHFFDVKIDVEYNSEAPSRDQIFLKD